MDQKELRSLGDVLDQLDACARSVPDGRVEQIMEAIGRRSFGPLLLIAGVLGMTPIAGVPGVPTLIATTVLIVSSQLLFGRERFWLPRFLLRLRVPGDKLKTAVRIMRKPAAFMDRLAKPRFESLTRPMADRAVAATCVLLALMTPPLELLPFVAFAPSAAIAIFGLGLISRDGLLVMVGLVFAVGGLAFAVTRLLG